MNKKQRVIVGMSGGVDSSVTAALLLDQGYDVIGMTMQLLPEEDSKQSACCNLGAVHDAKKVCGKLGIPHYTINSRKAFQDHVINPFINSYANGETPNPCVECNRYIKFDELWSYADSLKADFVATGHYCQIKKDDQTNNLRIFKGHDPKKDQSYFLYMIPQEKLKHILFPLGHLTKDKVREIASEKQLINAKKADSQEICFVSQKSYKDYVKSHIPAEKKHPGEIRDLEGNTLGNHDGIYQFTIGQRKGLNLSAPHPLYVIKIDPLTQIVTVGQKEDLPKQHIQLHTFSITDPKRDITNENFEIKTRYQMKTIYGRVSNADLSNQTATIQLEIPQDGIAIGQSCVLYKNDELIGGGVISQSD